MSHTDRNVFAKAAVALAMVVVLLIGVAGSTAAATTETVNPADLSTTPGTTDWHIAYVAGSATSGIVAGPAVPPLGTGSLGLKTTGAADKTYIMNYDHAGTLLSAITALGYATYTDVSPQAPTLQLQIDPDGAGTGVPRLGGGSPVNFATLNFEPYHANTVTASTWQTWDVLTDGASVWASNVAGDGSNNGTQANPATWSEFIAIYPDAVISYGFGVNVGSGWSGTINGNVDALHIAYGSVDTTYDFEPAVLCTTTCYADAVNGNDLNGGASPADAFKTIQKAIDTVQAGGEVRVLPGSYDETASNRFLFDASGPYQFGLFIDKTLTLQGVTAADADITDPSATQASITTNATNSFGYSGVFVQGDGVTIAGLEFGDNAAGNNKTIEVIGDAFTFKNSFINVSDGGSLYFGDWRYNAGTDTPHMKTFTVDNNIFSDGSSVDVSNGVGYGEPVAGRTITGNQFEFSAAMYTAMGNVSWPNVSFNGDTTTVPWFVHPVGGAVITGNTFDNTAPDGRHIRVRGVADDSDFDWESYWNDNTFNKAVIVGLPSPTVFDAVRSYMYTSGSYTLNDVRQIGAVIQPEVNHAVAGDTVLVNEGTYPEQVVITKSLDLVGEDGKALTTIQAPSTIPVASNPDSTVVKIAGTGVDAEISGFTIAGPGPTGCGSIGYGIFVRDNANADIHDNAISDIRDNPISGCQNGVGIRVGSASLGESATATIEDNMLSGYQKNGIVVSGAGSDADILQNMVTGAGAVNFIAQNGIQVSGGATAEIEENTITGHSYTPFTYVSTGMLFYGAGTTNTSLNTLTGNQVGIYIVDTSGDQLENAISATAAGTGSPGFWGIIVDAPPPARQPQPHEDLAAATAMNMPAAPTTPVQTVSLEGNAITSDGSTGGVGVEADAGFGSFDIDLTATKNLIHDWETGVITYVCDPLDYPSSCTGTTFTNLKFNRNSITGNVDLGFLNDNVTPDVDATCNWWGAADGPGPVGPGSGDEVSADVDFSDWLFTSNLDGTCGAPPPATVFAAASPGTANNDVEPDVAYKAGDVLKWDGTAWTKWFMGTAHGINPSADIIALDVVDPNAGSFYLSWRQMQAKVPGLGRIYPQDIVYFDGTNFNRFFEGKDVGLSIPGERVNGIEVLPGSESPIGTGCINYLLITTMAGGAVTNTPGPAIKFTGEDVLGFCMLTPAPNTTGLWHLALEGQSRGLPRNGTLGFAATEDGEMTYHTSKPSFPAGKNNILPLPTTSGPLGASVFNFTANGLTKLVDSIDYLP